ncbi:methyl-accepting chemotaxis protein [Inediibacterium massiliense]|uniref:methyl-accepting chemotaxis protein n=1 Tax=Inediibacterium massiliense TaxID=1658111 RepID=UPI0006B425DB|nr:methyl-accepting chemotaxis protein [Inediibacterium massiliense]
MRKKRKEFLLQTKIIIIVCVLILIIGIISSYIGNRSINLLGEQLLGEKALGIAQSVALTIDGEKFENLSKTIDSSNPYYENIRKQMLSIKKNAGVTFLYTIVEADHENYKYIIDGSDEVGGDSFSELGAIETKEYYPEEAGIALQTGTDVYTKIYDSDEYGYLISAFAPIKDSNGHTVGIVGCDVNVETFRSYISSFLIKLISITGVLMLLSIIVIVFLLKTTLKPLNRIVANIKQISKGDFTVHLDFNSNNEIGQLSNAMNSMVDQLKNMINEILGISNKVNDQSKKITQAANEVTLSSEQIALTMQEMAAASEEQATSFNRVDHSTRDLTNLIDHLNKSGMELEKSSNEVLDMANQGNDQMENSVHQMNIIYNLVKNSVGKAKGLNKKSKEISTLVEVIQQIADQTNLLALNAAIEAARAGEAGKGFAVVSQEIKNLAEQVAASLTEIIDIVNGIQNETHVMTQSLEAGYKEVEEGTEKIENTGTTFKNINDRVAQMVKKIETMSNDLESLLSHSNEIGTSIEQIATVAEENSASIEETAASAQQQNSCIEEVTKDTSLLVDLSEQLNSMVKNFKI